MNSRVLVKKILIWRLRHISNQRFILIISVLIGIVAAFAAFIIKYATDYIRLLLNYITQNNFENYFYFLYPVTGILITVILIKYLIKHRVGHGIPRVLYSISKERGLIKPHNMFSSIITSAFTVGFGGSVGLEGPTVVTGAAIGSNLSRILHLNFKQRILLLGCATAAAMAAIFNAPIAAIVFVIEVFMLDLTMTSLVPLLVSSSTAVIISYFIRGTEAVYHFTLEEPFKVNDVLWYVLLGIAAAISSIYFTKMYMLIYKLFDKITNRFKKVLIGGIVLGVLMVIFPSLYGEGYEIINQCLQGDFHFIYENKIFTTNHTQLSMTLILLTGILLTKAVATSVTLASGGVGGIFAPALFLGAILGILFAIIANKTGFAHLSERNFALVGMAGTIAGILHSPLTAIFLIAELTSGYNLLIPLMIVSTISYIITRYFIKNSVYTHQLAKRNELLTHHADKNVLNLMSVQKLIETNFNTISPDATLYQLVKIISKSSRNIFPVVDNELNFYGMILMDDIREIIFCPDLYNSTKVLDLMVTPTYTIAPTETMEEVAAKFHKSDKFNIVVLDQKKYIGFVSRARVFSTYRRLLKQLSEE